MESTRDPDALSIKAAEVSSIANSTMTQINEPRSDKNIVVDKNAAKLPLITEAINETIAENNARAKEILELLSSLDLDPKSLPKDIQDSLTKVSAILRAEGLSEIDQTVLTIHMEHKNREAKKRAREERNLKMKYNRLCDRHTAVLEKRNEAQSAVETLKKNVASTVSSNEEGYAERIYMATKLQDYCQTVDSLEEKLTDTVVTDCYPHDILEKYDAYLHLMEELKGVDESLSKYGELPPNLSEARVVVEEKERYLQELELALFK